jgi:hypothetical protein
MEPSPALEAGVVLDTSTGSGGAGISSSRMLLSFERPARSPRVAPSPDLENCTVGRKMEDHRVRQASACPDAITVKI